MNTRSTALLVGLAMAAALATSGCGGSSSRPAATPTPSTSAPSASPLTEVQPRDDSSTSLYTFDSALTVAAQRRHVRAVAAEAAGNTPNPGSVTQSSTGDGVTTDSVSVSVERDVRGTVNYTVRETGGWSVDRASARVLEESNNPDDTYVEFHQAPGGGRGSGTGPGLYVGVITDIGAPAGQGGTEQDADYLAGGIWMRVPADATSVADYEFGAFVDGNDPFQQANLAGLTGTATYTGERTATAVYSDQRMNRNYIVEADVRLTADFGDASSLGSISGTVFNFRGEGPNPGPDGVDRYEGAIVSLEAARIGGADSGFFTGDTSVTDGSSSDPPLTGKWGGQFYGNGAAAGDHPGSVAGTFGGATADGSESFVGIYGAYLEQQ